MAEMPSVEARQTVLVTGASGFIASHTVQQLANQGYNVIGTVRGDPSSKRYAWIKDLSNGDKKCGTISLFGADLTKRDAFDEAVKGCHYILHIASPYIVDVKDPIAELVTPAVEGTLSVLKSAIKFANDGTLKRVVITSSCAAITDEPIKMYTEQDWNVKSSLHRNPYYYSKVRAEKTAWKFMEDNKAALQWDLCVVNPWMTIGPQLGPSTALNTSNDAIFALLDGRYPLKLSVSWGVGDVRDVAEAHIKIMKNRDAAGRYLCANVALTVSEMCDIALKYCSEQRLSHKLPTIDGTYSILKYPLYAFSYLQPTGVGQFLRTNLYREARFDNSKVKSVGVSFRPVERTIRDTIQYLVDIGLVKSVDDVGSNHVMKVVWLAVIVAVLALIYAYLL